MWAFPGRSVALLRLVREIAAGKGTILDRTEAAFFRGSTRKLAKLDVPSARWMLADDVIGLHTVDGSPLFQNPRDESRRDNIYKASAELLPSAGTRVRLVFTRVVRQASEGTRRIYALISGRVRGMGFREFVQRQAAIRGLKGFVRSLGDERIEVVAEGPAAGVDEFR